jgi:hypothetical protein
LKLLLPQRFSLELRANQLLLGLLSENDATLTLFTCEISLGEKRDFSGTGASLLLEALAGSILSAWNGVRDDPATFDEKLKVITGTALESAVRDAASTPSFLVRLGNVHTANELDWF